MTFNIFSTHEYINYYNTNFINCSFYTFILQTVKTRNKNILHIKTIENICYIIVYGFKNITGVAQRAGAENSDISPKKL